MKDKIDRLNGSGIQITVTSSENKINSINLQEGNFDKPVILQQSTPYAEIFLLYLLGKNPDLNIPIDSTRLTPFQTLTFKALKKVSYGNIISYEELAILTKSIRHRRAVAQALAHNPYPIIIPCHRVLSKKWDIDHIGGFSGGIDLKRKLLLLENPQIFNS